MSFTSTAGSCEYVDCQEWYERESWVDSFVVFGIVLHFHCKTMRHHGFDQLAATARKQLSFMVGPRTTSLVYSASSS